MASLLMLTIISFLSFSSAFSQEKESKQLETYIVHLNLPIGLNSSQLEDLKTYYHSFLPKTSKGLNDLSRIVFSYRKVITGFAARLSPEEVEEMEKIEGFVYARPQEMWTLKTTRTPEFLGLNPNSGLWNQSNLGKGMIIGLVDNGIKADHPSFRDEGMPSPPKHWKGKCNLEGIKCNNKLIGARNFFDESKELPVEPSGHGTHTASTAAGNFVQGANVFGNANGTAVGMAPHAHLAMYEVCVGGYCSDAAIVAAMEAAIEEKVHVLSLSLGSEERVPYAVPFYNDIIAIGAFRAIQEGIFVSCSASNEGPIEASLSNEAPWILTVGASTIDRNIRATILLGNNVEIHGESMIQPNNFTSSLLPLVYGNTGGDLKGHIVFYEMGVEDVARIENLGSPLKNDDAAAFIIMNNEVRGSTIKLAPIVDLPTVQVSFTDGEAIKVYMNSTLNPVATILFRGTVVGVKSAPEVAHFSSRGPSLASPGILKPDIIGPGVSILAAWPYSVDQPATNTTSTFNMIHGTSMSCPHLSGIAALLRSVYPDWSPAAIKSAIMTTADTWNLNNDPILDQRQLRADVFAIGAGHVNPSRAADPGLIYDISPNDYINYLCGLGYTDANISIILNRGVDCSLLESIPEAQLNYPSFAIQLGSKTQTYTRTVANVGKARSTYKVEIELIPGVDIHVRPLMLKFRERNQQETYTISFSRSGTAINNSYVQGAISWGLAVWKENLPAIAGKRMNAGQDIVEFHKGSLDEIDVKGKVVLCEASVLPTTDVTFDAGQGIKAYINSTSMPTAIIVFNGTVLGVKNAPTIAIFSSRGPNIESLD
ncbi:hypothetical protein ACH5RR_038535 [Cinchona calisaya]|uniref:Uncharacterized protein n=1 Tax=Cinchona calisaya TaxID=153742 RepID=A0ABD2Y0V7_9GENT